MAKAESAAAVAVLETELTDRELVDSCSWHQILKVLEENVVNSRPSFSTTASTIDFRSESEENTFVKHVADVAVDLRSWQKS
jgi:hypothetical protein